jgi:hypothetical protein
MGPIISDRIKHITFGIYFFIQAPLIRWFFLLPYYWQIKRDTPFWRRLTDPFCLLITPSRSSQREGFILKFSHQSF